MTVSVKKRLGIIAAASSLAHLAVYLLFHLPTLVIYVESDFWYSTLYYAHDLLSKLLSAMLPVLCAAAALSVCPTGGVKAPMTVCGLLSLTKLIYLFPYTYSYALLSYGYDSVAALLIALGVSIGYAALGMGYAYLLYLLMLKVGRGIVAKTELGIADKAVTAAGESSGTEALSESFARSIGAGGALDLSAPYTAAVFAAGFAGFCLQLLAELAEIIIYLVEYAGTYKAGEIIYIVAALMTLLVALFASHLLGRAVGKVLVSASDTDSKSN